MSQDKINIYFIFLFAIHDTSDAVHMHRHREGHVKPLYMKTKAMKRAKTNFLLLLQKYYTASSSQLIPVKVIDSLYMGNVIISGSNIVPK